MRHRNVMSVLIAISIVALVSLFKPIVSFADVAPDLTEPAIGLSITDAKTGTNIPIYKNACQSRAADNENQAIAIAHVSTLENTLTGNKGIATFSVDVLVSSNYMESSTKQTPDIRATVNLHYDKNGNDICITRASGEWVPLTTGVLVDSRTVIAGQGVIGLQTKTWYPTVNSFSYPTGWSNYVPAGSGLAGGRYNQVRSLAHYVIPGMGSGYNIEAYVMI